MGKHAAPAREKDGGQLKSILAMGIYSEKQDHAFILPCEGAVSILTIQLLKMHYCVFLC